MSVIVCRLETLLLRLKITNYEIIYHFTVCYRLHNDRLERFDRGNTRDTGNTEYARIYDENRLNLHRFRDN